MALIDLNAPKTGAGSAQSNSLREAEKEIAALTGNARTVYRLRKDLERDEELLREMVDRPPKLEEL